MTYKDKDDYHAINGYNFYLEYLDEFIADWGDVDRVDELIDLFRSLEDNEVFCRFASFDKIEDDNGEQFSFNYRKLPFIRDAFDGLGHDYLIPLYIPEITHKIVTRDQFNAAYALVMLSFASFSGHYLKYDEGKVIMLSDIVPALTFFVEDFDKGHGKLPDFDVGFFRRLHHLNWEDKSAKKFEIAIGRVLRSVYGMWSLEFIVARTFRHAAYYLMACNALKNGRSGVSVDDVLVAYITAFKVALNDIRPVLRMWYDEEKDWMLIIGGS